MNQAVRLFLKIALLASMGLTACKSRPGSDLPPGFTAPDPQILAAARAFKRQFPNSHYYMSARSGTLLWLDNGGSALSSLTGSYTDALVDLNQRHPDLLKLNNPAQELKIVGARNTLGTSTGAPNTETVLTSVRFSQYFMENPVNSRSLIAYYNSASQLIAIQANITPSERLEVVTGITSPVLASNQHTKARHTDHRRYQFIDLNPDTDQYDLYEREETLDANGFIRRKTLDVSSGAVLTDILEMPSDITPAQTLWFAGGQTVSTAALDNLSATQNILSFKLASQGMAMAFALEGIMTGSQFVTVGDAKTQPTLMPSVPFTTDQNDWSQESAFDSVKDATGLVKNVETTLTWFDSEQNWKSWDNQGSRLRTSIHSNFNNNPETPQLNAFGGSGMIYVCDGKTDTGQTLGDSLDIIAHEFTHSVISATADFQYYHEAGALNEALADFFGAAVEGFQNNTIGEDVGYILRDLLRPQNYGQPATYSQYAAYEIDMDNGGVHVNSGIINRAFALTVLGHGNSYPAQGWQSTSRLVMNALKNVAYNTEARLEDYAAATLGFCKLQPAIYSDNLCNQLEHSFEETELLNGTI